MPRKARPQRTDLNMTKVTVPGQDYGKQAEQRRAMSAVPTVNMQQQLTSMQRAAAPLEHQQTAAIEKTPMGMPPAMPTQQAPILFDHPEDNGQHLTAGLPTGPGPGPEAAGLSADQSVAAMLGKLAQGPYATPAIKSLADFAMLMGQ